jgi:four helix bundle protein
LAVGALARQTDLRSDEAGEFAKDYALKDQIRRSAVSTMSNIAEGFERDGKAEFAQFLSIAKGSMGEVEAQLFVALDQGYISEARFDDLRRTSDSIKRMIAGLMRYLRQSDVKGLKYKPVEKTPD